MKQSFLRTVLVSVAISLTASAGARGQHLHDVAAGPSGGQMLDVAGHHAELVVKDTTVIVNIFDQDSTQARAIVGFTATALINNNGIREIIPMSGSGNTFKAVSQHPLNAGTIVALRLRSPTGQFGQARIRL